MLDLVEEDVDPGCRECCAPPLPLGEATGVVVEVFMIFSGGLGEEVGSALASAASEAAAESEIVTMPPPSPEVAEVFVMAACPFPMAVSSASVEAEMKLEALVVDVMLLGYSGLLIMLLLPPEC